MAKPRKQRPDGIVLYQQSLSILSFLPDETAGKAIKAAIAYFTNGAELEDTQSMEFLAYSVLRVDIDNALGRFREKCERNRRNRNGGEEQPETTDGDQSSPVVTNGDQNREENELSRNEQKKGTAKPSTPSRKKYGQYGWVKLSDEEYQRLVKDLGQAEVERCINYIDESAQATGNRNRWKDWNLIIRKCSRDRWGVNGTTQTPPPPPAPRGRYETVIVDGEAVDIPC